MGELKVKDKDIVTPGDILATGMDYLPSQGTYRDGEKIICSQVGFVNINNRLIKIIPLSGKYVPRPGDTVIGIIKDMNFSNWFLDIGCAYEATMSIKNVHEYVERDADLTNYYNYGDIVCAKVIKVTRSKVVDLTTKVPGLRKLFGGKIIEIIPSKVPRIIGKEGSMVNIIKDATGCRITVGQNGRIWIQGTPENELIATEVIKKVEKEAQKEGLTDEIKAYLEKRIPKKEIKTEEKKEIKEEKKEVKEEKKETKK